MAVDGFTAIKTAKESLPYIERFLKWVVKKRYPKAPRKKLGFAVAIYTDGSVRREQITNDFILTLEKLSSTSIEPGFALVDVPPHLAEKIKTKDQAARVLAKTGCVFLIFGRARLRNIKKQPTYVLDLDSMVTHDLIPEEISKRLSAEMKELLPTRTYISQDNDLEGFEVHAASVTLSVRYIIATAALLSRQYDYARKLFKELRPQLTVKGDIPPFIKRSIKLMRQRIPNNLVSSHVMEARELHQEWRKTRSASVVDEIQYHLGEAERLSPDFYDVWLLRAVNWFAKGDISAARAEINKCRIARVVDPTWRLSDAFLLAYSGKLTDALRAYRMVANMGVPSSTWLEVEEFISARTRENPIAFLFGHS